MKHLKKAVTALLAFVLAITCLAACGAPAANEPAASQSESSTEESQSVSAEPAESAGQSDSAEESKPASAEAGEDKKIGVIFYSKDDSLGQAVYATLNYAAEALGIELVWKLGDLDPTAQITAAENMVAAGCDGILCIPMSEVVTQKVGKLCEENQVYFAICFRTITDETLKKEVDSYEYYVGSCSEDEKQAGANMVKIMADAGKKNCTVNYFSPGNALAARNAGIDQGMEEYGVNKLGEYTIPENADLNAMSSTIENYINTYKELDVIFSASSAVGMGEAMINTLNTHAPAGKIQLATFDVFDGMKEAFEDKSLGCAVGGMSPDALFTFMMLYNSVMGTPLSNKPEYIYQNYIYVTNAEECEGYEKYIDNPEYMIYKAEDIQAMSKVLNPDFTLDEMKKIMSEYTMENVMKNAE